MKRFANFIGGKACEPASGAWVKVFDPARAEPWAEVAACDARDVDDAVNAALAAFPAWAALRNSERSRHLENLARALEARIEDFAHAEAHNGGSPYVLDREADIPRALSNLRLISQAATQYVRESHHGETGLNYTLRHPMCVVGTISPWNLPLYLFTWKIAPALAAG